MNGNFYTKNIQFQHIERECRGSHFDSWCFNYGVNGLFLLFLFACGCECVCVCFVCSGQTIKKKYNKRMRVDNAEI